MLGCFDSIPYSQVCRGGRRGRFQSGCHGQACLAMPRFFHDFGHAHVNHGRGGKFFAIVFIAVLFSLLRANIGRAQSFHRGGTEFNAMRVVELGTGKSFNAVVTEFYHHGEIAPDGRNVIVAAKDQLVPCRLLQLGPGDFCRLAFQTIKGQLEYDILYGGEPPAEPPPPWTCQDGLALGNPAFQEL